MPYKYEHIDPEQVKKLASMNCRLADIGAFFDVSHDTISRHFAKEFEAGKAMFRRRLSQAQVILAIEKLNCDMLKWLGRNELGQTDKIEMNMTFNVPKLQVIEADTQAKTVLEIAPPSADNNSL